MRRQEDIHNKVVDSWNNVLSLADNLRYQQQLHDQLCDDEAEVNKNALRMEIE